MVEAARLGRSGCVLVRGEPGIGKSALVDDVVSRAGLRVLRTQGLESEAPLAYAALHRLMRPLLALVDALPPPQARALRIAFGEAEGARLEPFLVGLATLSLLTSAAEDEPLVCMVDDAHWLDAASADAMLFTARRLDADRLAICFVARHPDDTGFEPEGIPTLTLGALDEGSARALLLDSVGELPAEVSDRLLAETGGNPLALKELPTALSPAQRDGSEPLPATLPLTRSVERAFLERCRQLSEAAQTVLLVAVADGTGRLATLERAARALGIGTDAFDAVVRTGLLVVTGDNADVQHPLVRSAIYQAAGDRERRRVHEALAEVLGDLQDPDRQTWHLAAVADGPDPALAAALDDVAVRAESRGAHRAAADAHERAAELGEASAAAGRRFAAARSAWASGRARHASTLVAAARADVDDPLLRADLDRLRARIEVNTGSAHDAHRILTRAAERVAAHDPLRALEMAVAASVARSHGADSGAVLPAGTVDIRDAADDTARTRSLKHLLLSSEHAMVGERAGAVAELQVARSAGRTTEDLDLLGNLGNDALHLGEDEAHRELYALMLSVARERGDGMAVLYALQRSAFGLYLAGSWVELRSTCEEAVSLGRSVGQRASTATPLAWLTLVAALQGSPDHDGHRVALDELLTSHPARGILARPLDDLVHWSSGVRAALTGDRAGALHHLRELRLPTMRRLAAHDRIDAAVRAGDQGLARDWTVELEEFAAGTTLPWAQATALFGRALVADPDRGEDPDELFRRALGHQALAGRPYDRARTQLAHGELLRRSGRRADARLPLREALATLQDLRADPLAARATEELRASGETARRRDESTLLTLTPMERKVALLVSEGLSNKEVAAQCWVSPRTVAFHLRNVFAKAGVTSRGELARLDLG